MGHAPPPDGVVLGALLVAGAHLWQRGGRPFAPAATTSARAAGSAA
ncbi:hypothetical protein [Streptomyces sp. JNUCC 63]